MLKKIIKFFTVCLCLMAFVLIGCNSNRVTTGTTKHYDADGNLIRFETIKTKKLIKTPALSNDTMLTVF